MIKSLTCFCLLMLSEIRLLKKKFLLQCKEHFDRNPTKELLNNTDVPYINRYCSCSKKNYLATVNNMGQSTICITESDRATYVSQSPKYVYTWHSPREDITCLKNIRHNTRILISLWTTEVGVSFCQYHLFFTDYVVSQMPVPKRQ